MKKYVVILLHVGYWMLYGMLLILMLLAVKHSVQGLGNVFLSPFGALTVPPAVFGFYSFYSIIFPKYLQQKKWGKLALSIIIACSVSSLFSASMIALVFGFKLMLHGGGWYPATALSLFMAGLTALHGTIALVMKGFITWYGDIKIKEDMNKKNYETELALVKSQINPHFLFNTINNIDVLIEKDPEKASAYLNKLSDMMRFMLYETKTGQIPLEKELSYIEKYIELQKIRTSNESYVNYTVKGHTGQLAIDPMIFIPFIENAFKHSGNKKAENAINIGFVIEANRITFEVSNLYSRETTSIGESGVGNELIKKRLDLLYKNRHALDITDRDGKYKVELTIEA